MGIDNIGIVIGLTILAVLVLLKSISFLRKNSHHFTYEEIKKQNEISEKELKKYNELIQNDIKLLMSKYLETINSFFLENLPAQSFLSKLHIFINSNMLSAISIVTLSKDKGEARKTKTIVGIMLHQKLNSALKFQIILIASLILNLIFSLLNIVEFSSLLLILVSSALLIIHIDHQLIEYRVRNGWYGKSEFEAKEIINFIISNADKNDFNDSDGLKIIIPAKEHSVTESASSGFIGGKTL